MYICTIDYYCFIFNTQTTIKNFRNLQSVLYVQGVAQCINKTIGQAKMNMVLLQFILSILTSLLLTTRNIQGTHISEFYDIIHLKFPEQY